MSCHIVQLDRTILHERTKLDEVAICFKHSPKKSRHITFGSLTERALNSIT
jgi:hypothetical protein